MKFRTSTKQTAAMTLTEVVVVIFVIALAVALLLPALAAAKSKRARISCVSNVKQIGIAFRLWVGDNHDRYPMAVSVTNGGAMEWVATGNVAAYFQMMSNELSTPIILVCPEDTHRVYATNFSTGFSGANISYFVNADATEAYPQMILNGDDNLLVDGKPVQPGILNLWTNQTIAWTKDRHYGMGNIGMADGSAMQTTSAGLNSAIVSSTSGASTNTTVNRWLIP